MSDDHKEWDTGYGLPSWTYTDPAFLELEAEGLLKRSWQLIAHESELPNPGDYVTLPFLGELFVAVRGRDRQIRVFHNVCRHRGAQLLDGDTGSCGGRIVCPYHAWTYGLDGELIGVPEREQYATLDEARLGLKQPASESCGGFIFVRPSDHGVSFDEYIAPIKKELELYHTAEMKPFAPVRRRERAVNWKVATDNYADAMHIPVAHPGLHALSGGSYQMDVDDAVYRFSAEVSTGAAQNPSVRAYSKFLPKADHLPPDRQRKWIYALLFPNLAFDIYPDQIDYMQFIPLGAGRTLLRETAYALPDSRREMKAARYLNWRINRLVNVEDKGLIERVQSGMASSSFAEGPLGRQEVCLRDFAARMRHLFPLARHSTPPTTEQYAQAIDLARRNG